MNQSERCIFLINELIKEDSRYSGVVIPETSSGRRELLRGLMNIRAPRPVRADILSIQDEYLRTETLMKGVTDERDIPEVRSGIAIWQGDITTLKCGAIVNAANSGMTGCYIPNHRCIDNAIHTYAGMQLRLCCDDMMKKQGYEEPAGCAKITEAYNLPSEYIIHTVGPIIKDRVRKKDEELLHSCYSSCLELAADNSVESIAFCCISTGEFHFPNKQAAEIAVKAVEEFMERRSSIRKVIFNVFKDEDRKIYEDILRMH